MEFEIGTSKTDITPNYGSPTRRWHLKDNRARITDICWPLYARTVALSDGKTTTAITSMEVACLYKCHLDHIRALVRDMTPAPIDNIILHCTHQHSDSFIEYEPSYDVFGINDIAFDMDYIRSIARKVASSICLAVRALTPAKVGYASGAVEEGIASCRRVLTNDRQLVGRGSRPTQELRVLPRGHIDPEVGVVAFLAPDGKPLATLYNYACHPSSAGGDSPNICSADFPGFASDMIEKCHGGTALFLHGCSGDINPGKYVRGDSLDPDDRIADARRMGQILAGEVFKTIGTIKVQHVEHFRTRAKDCLLPVQDEAGNVEQCLANARKALDEWRKKGTDPRTALRKYVVSKKIVDGRCPVTMFALSINGLAMGFIPGEPFTEFGERIKKNSGADQMLLAATCGEDPFYIPTREAIAQGGYETGYIASPETGEAMLKDIQGLLAICVKEGG